MAEPQDVSLGSQSEVSRRLEVSPGISNLDSLPMHGISSSETVITDPHPAPVLVWTWQATMQMLRQGTSPSLELLQPEQLQQCSVVGAGQAKGSQASLSLAPGPFISKPFTKDISK